MVPGAVFKGLAVGFFNHRPALYATDIGKNRAWWSTRTSSVWRCRACSATRCCRRLHTVRHPGDRQRLIVSYAQFPSGAADEPHGPGFGFVDVYTQNGHW